MSILDQHQKALDDFTALTEQHRKEVRELIDQARDTLRESVVSFVETVDKYREHSTIHNFRRAYVRLVGSHVGRFGLSGDETVKVVGEFVGMANHDAMRAINDGLYRFREDFLDSLQQIRLSGKGEEG